MRYKIDPLTGGLLPAQNDSTVSISSSTGGSGIVESIVAGANVIVDSTDPANPIVSATGGGGTTDHSALSNLDYASAGHTGFQPAGAYLTDISGQDLSTANNTTSAFITAGDIPAIPDSVDDLSPSQTGNNGKFLKTDGTNATWESIPGGGDMLAATYDPAGGAKQVAFASDIPTQYTDEMAQDAVGNAVGNGLDYDDTTGAISVDETELTHNSLGSKQGGTTNEYYHLTSAEVSGLHAAATVADSTSIDMSITGQQISAAAIFGTDAGTVCQGNDARLSDARTPVAHNQAESTITFTNITTGNATTSAHGYVPIATAPASGLYNYVGITNGETAYTNKALFDATVPSTQAFGDAAATGSATVAARRDHKHAMPAAEKDTTAITGILKGNGTTISAATADTDYVSTSNQFLNPTGAMMQWSARVAPTGWLICDGSAVSRTTYATLFGVISPTIGTFTVTIASPGVVTMNNHGFVLCDAVYLTTTGALPTGLSANTIYYVIYTNANSFKLATSYANAVAGTAINTSGSQSGTHSIVYCPWGLGDGSTTFNVPDARNKVLAGYDSNWSYFRTLGAASNVGEMTHTLAITEMPAHNHGLDASISTFNDAKTALSSNRGTTNTAWYYNATTQGGGQAHNNLQPYIVINHIIKT